VAVGTPVDPETRKLINTPLVT